MKCGTKLWSTWTRYDGLVDNDNMDKYLLPVLEVANLKNDDTKLWTELSMTCAP
jgi:hypothetical protein